MCIRDRPPADRPGVRCRPADSRAGLADRAAAAPQSSPPWAWSCRSSNGVGDSAAVAAGCTSGPPRWRPAAGIPAGRTADTRAAECAAWPVRSRSRAPHRRWPAAPRRRGYSVAGSGAADSGPAGSLRWPGSGRSAASPGPDSGRSSSPGSAATSRAPRGLVSGIAVGAEPAPPSRKPAGDFRLRTGCLRWLLEKPRSAPGSASLLRARWWSILSMPPAPGSSCIGNCLLLQAHLVLEKTDRYHLYAYDEIFAVPLGTKVLDARLVLFVDRIFRDRNGSYSGFSNFFRYKLLLDVGGWWVDLDLHRSPPSQITGELQFLLG